MFLREAGKPVGQRLFYVNILLKVKGGLFWIFSFYVLYSTLLHLLPLRFHCVGGCWDRTQDFRDLGIDRQTL